MKTNECVSWILGCVSRKVSSPFPHLLKDDDVVSCCLDLSIPCISFRVNGLPVQGMFENFNANGLLYPVVSFSAGVKLVSTLLLFLFCFWVFFVFFLVGGVMFFFCFFSRNPQNNKFSLPFFLENKTRVRFLFGGRHGEFRFLPPPGYASCSEALLPKVRLKVQLCQEYIVDHGEGKQELIGPLVPVTPVTFTPTTIDISKVNLVLQIWTVCILKVFITNL